MERRKKTTVDAVAEVRAAGREFCEAAGVYRLVRWVNARLARWL